MPEKFDRLTGIEAVQRYLWENGIDTEFTESFDFDSNDGYNEFHIKGELWCEGNLQIVHTETEQYPEQGTYMFIKRFGEAYNVCFFDVSTDVEDESPSGEVFIQILESKTILQHSPTLFKHAP